MINITLQIDPSQLGETVLDVFNNLSTEKREEIAYGVLDGWMKDPATVEYSNYREQLIHEYRTGKRKPYWSFGNTSSIEDIIKDDNFIKDLSEFKDTKQGMIEEIRLQMKQYFQKEISKKLESDPMITEIINATYVEIQKRLPELIMKTLMLSFNNNINHLQDSINRYALGDSITKDLTDNVFKDIMK
jgi:hypothetical protein